MLLAAPRREVTVTRVLLLGSNERATLAVCRSLGLAGAQVEILRFDAARTPADHSKYCAASHFLGVPYPDVAWYSGRLLEFVERRGYDVVFPMTDVANELAYCIYEQLRQVVRLVGPSPEHYRMAANKHTALAIGEEAGVRAPGSLYLVDPDAPIPDVRYPIYAKPVRSALVRDNYLHTLTVRKVRSRGQLEAKLRDDLSRLPVILQDEIVGRGIGLNFCAYRGVLFGASTTARIHEPIDGGGSSYRRTGELTPHLLRVAAFIAERLDWTGMMMVELRYDGSDFFLMELNGRPWGSIEVAIQSGVDFPRLVVDAMIRGAPPGGVVVPRRHVYVRNLKSDVGWLWRRRRTWFSARSDLPRWLSSFSRVVRRRETFDVEQLSDPLPALAQISAMVSAAVARSRRLLRRALPLPAEAADHVTLKPVSKIAFVCRGNINRSVVAERYLAARGFGSVHSAGLIGMHGRRPSAQAEAYLATLGIEAAQHRSRDIRTAERDLITSDLVVTFDRRDLVELTERYPMISARVRLLSAIGRGGRQDIDDPQDRPDPDYKDRFDRIIEHLDALVGASPP